MDQGHIATLEAWLEHNEVSIRGIENQIDNLGVEIQALHKLRSALKLQRDVVESDLEAALRGE